MPVCGNCDFKWTKKQGVLSTHDAMYPFCKKTQQSIEQNRAKAMVQLKSPISKAEIPLKNVVFESSPPCSWRHWSGDPTNNNENGGGAICGEGK